MLMDYDAHNMSDHTEGAPINSVIGDERRFEANPGKHVHITTLPKFLRFFWFLILGVMGLGITLLIITVAIR
jgi:hypothetical protein